MGDCLGISFFHQFLGLFRLDEGLDGYFLPGPALLFLGFGLILVLLKPFFPVILFVLIGGDPVEEGHDVLGFGAFDGGLAEDGVAAHIEEAFVLLIVLHDSKKYQIDHINCD